jgi:hypothetical protein
VTGPKLKLNRFTSDSMVTGSNPLPFRFAGSPSYPAAGSLDSMARHRRLQRIDELVAGQLELRTPPDQMPLDSQGLRQLPPAQLLEPAIWPGDDRRPGDTLLVWCDCLNMPEQLRSVALTTGEAPDISLLKNCLCGYRRAFDRVSTRLIDKPDTRAGCLIVAGPVRR